MVSRIVWSTLLLVAFTFAPWTSPAYGQLFPGLFGQCGVCARPCQPTCVAPMPCSCCACTGVAPVARTQYVPQQTVTYKDIPRTEYRQQAYVETTPATVYQNVTVDEGGYQQVWVPKLVTKSVARTVYQQHVKYRAVPYQVNQRVAQVSTQLIPQQAVGYMPYSYQTASTCASCGPVPTAAAWPTSVAPNVPVIRSTRQPVPTMPALTVPQPKPLGVDKPRTQPTPDPKFSGEVGRLDDHEWTVVQSRGTMRGTGRAERSNRYDEVPAGVAHQNRSREDISRTASARGMFVPAPSAARVWQSQSVLR